MPYKDKEKNRACTRAWLKKNKKYIKSYNARWQKEHPEYMREANRKYRENNPEKILKKNQRHRKMRPDLYKAKDARRRTAKQKSGGSFTAEEWKSLKKKFSYRCLRCNKRKPLTPDHVVPVSKGGTSNIDNIQPLCGPCNSWKKDKVVDFR